MTKENKPLRFGLILAVYLLGIFMGALDTGIVTPARTVIQDSLGVDEKSGIWMITIYTLAYASSIPVMGKLADRMGRRNIYLVSIFLFGLGSLLCGVSHNFESFPMLLISRVIQAIGGGGILPVATAEFGTTFPEEKRGMALGMVGGVYGIANIFGASAGSLIMDIFGTDKWEFIFYVNIPITIFILIAGFKALPNTKEKATSPIDIWGICILVVMILSLLYGLKNIDFFDFIATISQPEVYICLIVFLVLLPLFIIVEKKAKDPVMNLKYFTNVRILMTLCVTVITGIVLIGLVFIPEFCENALKVPSGSGGYFVIILGVCAGVGAMSSGHMTDKMGPKLVLSIGFIASIIGSLIVIFFASQDPNKLNVFAALIFIGFGIGFTMGAPLNYMMLWEVPERESNSALATLSLVRSLGTVVAPAIMVGFISHAGMNVTDEINALLPTEVKIPSLPYANELQIAMEEQGVDDMPDLESMTTIEIDMSGTKDSDIEIPDEIINELQSSSVTTIVASVKHMATYMFDEMSPKIQDEIYAGIDEGIKGMDKGLKEMDDAITSMESACSGMQNGINGVSSAIAGVSSAKIQMAAGYNQLKAGYDQVLAGIDAMEKAYKEEEAKPGDPVQKAQKLAQMRAQINAMKEQASTMKASLDKMSQGMSDLDKELASLQADLSSQKKSQSDMKSSIAQIKQGREELASTRAKTIELRNAIPGAFETAKQNYLKEIDKKAPQIESAFQKTMNVGFRQIFILTAISSGVGLLLLIAYRRRKEDVAKEKSEKKDHGSGHHGKGHHGKRHHGKGGATNENS